MGTRSQVFMVNSGVYLYQHWDGYNLPLEVQEALKLKARWNDEEYLTRIIFETMLENAKYEGWDDTEESKLRHKTLSFGIGIQQHSDIEWLVEVNVETQTIKIREGYDQLAEIWNGTFEQFLNIDASEEALEEAQN